MILTILSNKAKELGIPFKAYVLYILEQRRELGYKDDTLYNKALLGELSN